MEVEDDVFFADLSKQLTLLIMDDDEDPIVQCPSVSLQVYYSHLHDNYLITFMYKPKIHYWIYHLQVYYIYILV